MAEIIGHVGVIGSGKNYCQDLLVKKGFIALDFKYELIAMVSDLVGYNISEDYEYFKSHIVGVRRPQNPAEDQIYNQMSSTIIANCPEAMTGRRLLQRMGTETMRARDPDFWVKAWTKKAREYLTGGFSVAVADVRFQNEIQAILGLAKELGISHKIMFCDFRSDRYDPTSAHLSEAIAQEFLKAGYQDGQEIAILTGDIPEKLTPGPQAPMPIQHIPPEQQ